MTRRIITTMAVLAATLAFLTGQPATASSPHTAMNPAAVAIPTGAEVYLIGDSITSTPGSWAYRWQQRICGTESTCLPHVHVGVAGGTGACLLATCDGHPPLVEEWDTVVLQAIPKPTTIVVEIGTNDLFTPGITAEQFAAAYKHLMFSGIDAGIRVIIATIPPTLPRWPWHNAHNPLRVSVDNWLLGYFGDANIFNIDSGLKIYGTNDADPYYYDLPSGHESDGLHPSLWGQDRISTWLDPARVI